MKNLKDMIRESINRKIDEAYEKIVLNEVDAKFDVHPDVLYIEAPDHWNESDLQTYMNDMWLNKLPSGQDYSEKLFGPNFENIYDIYFEYNKYEHLDKNDVIVDTIKPECFIKWDDYYKKGSTETIGYYRITELKYVIKFDRFELLDSKTDDYSIRNTLEKIFENCNSSSINKYPIEIEFDKKTLKFER